MKAGSEFERGLRVRGFLRRQVTIGVNEVRL